MAAGEKRVYTLIDESTGAALSRFHSPTARGAALKAVAHGVGQIVLLEAATSKLYVFSGRSRELSASEHTAFTRKNGISSRPVVRKLSYEQLRFDAAAPEGRAALIESMRELTGR